MDYTEIKRNDTKLLSVDYYKKILDTESHHDHKIVVDEHGTVRWKQDPWISYLIDNKIDLNALIHLFHKLGIDRNSEPYRKLYRELGYSLSGYWEVFYWELNNEDAANYSPPLITSGIK